MTIIATLGPLSLVYLTIAAINLTKVIYEVLGKPGLLDGTLAITSRVKRVAFQVALFGAFGTVALFLDGLNDIFTVVDVAQTGILEVLGYYLFALATKQVLWVARVVVRI